MSSDVGELQRIVSQLLRIGVVQSVTGDEAIVEIGGVPSPGLQWASRRAGADAEWWAPEQGEQVVVFAPYGDMAQAVILFSLYQDLFPAPSTNPDVHRVTYKNGTVVQHDRSAQQYLVQVPAGGNITLQVGSTSLVLQDGTATLNAENFNWNGNSADFSGTLLVQLLLSFMNGIAGQKGTASNAAAIQGGMTVTGGDVVVDNVGVKSHHHIEHDGPLTSNAQI